MYRKIMFDWDAFLTGVRDWQKKIWDKGALFSASAPLGRSYDALSLHIDLNHMIGTNLPVDSAIEELKKAQDPNTGFWFEPNSEEELRNHPHPRVMEMAGTYLGFQISGLFQRLNVHANPIHFWDFLTESRDSIRNYLNAMPWLRSPWGAGGWVDSLATMLRANVLWGRTEFQSTLDEMFQWLEENQDPKTGLWGAYEVQGLAGQVNGTYHLLRGTWLNDKLSVPHKKSLINSIISLIQNHELFQNGSGEACYDLDSWYLLVRLVQQEPDYRTEEIKDLARIRLENIMNRINSDGAFGYFINRSTQLHNYHVVGKNVNDESDIQGTVFYLTVIHSLNTLLNVPKVPWEVSLTHG